MSETAVAPLDRIADRGPLAVAPFVAAAALDVAALAVLLTHATARPLLVAGALHLGALLPLVATPLLTASERVLAAAFAFALPVVGAPLAALALGTEGESALEPPPPPLPGTVEPPRVDELRQLGEALPCCEALLSASAEERRAIIATLTRRADADAVALLRWALGAADADLAVDAAVAMEEMAASFEARLAEARAALAAPPGGEAAPATETSPDPAPAPTPEATPGAESDSGAEAPGAPETALAAAEMVTQAIAAGIVDPALVAALAREARGYFIAAARDADPERALAAALGRGHLELEVLRPDTALACIDDALSKLGPEAEPALLALREEAVLASHALPWEGPSALATYQQRGVLPPPLTARRRFGTGRASVRAGTGGMTVGPVHVPPLSSTHKVPRDAPGSTHKIPRDGPGSTHKVPRDPRAAGPAAGTGGVKVGPVQIPPLSSTHKVPRDDH
jgi:hypothetical protein